MKSTHKYEYLHSVLTEFNKYINNTFAKIDELQSQITVSKNQDPLFDLSELYENDINYLKMLKQMDSCIFDYSILHGFSLKQSIEHSLFDIEQLINVGEINSVYTIDTDEKKKINEKLIYNISEKHEIFKKSEDSFNNYISRGLLYEQALKSHLDYINSLDYEVENENKIKNELEKTKFLIPYNTLFYLGYTTVLDILFKINKLLVKEDLWCIGSDFINCFDTLFIQYTEDNSTIVPLGEDILNKEVRISSFLKKSIGSIPLEYIETGKISDDYSEKIEKLLYALSKEFLFESNI